MNNPIDHAQRTAALNLHHSIIVQAPAGSGKTELLCQRFLMALSSVTQPEQVLAITFTRKAAQEMHERIMHYIGDLNHLLGQKVRAQDEKYQWHLLTHPERLSVMTIDSLCALIMNEAPIDLALHGYQVTEDASALYRYAADLFFAEIDESHPWQPAFYHLLSYCHNRWQSVHDLCVNMLAKREQWLMLLPELNQPEYWRTRLESNLSDCVHYAIEELNKQLSSVEKQKLLHLLHYAAKHNEVFHIWLTVSQWPEADLAQAMLWRTLPDFLLTQDNQLRKTVDKRLGFPVGVGSDKEYCKNTKQAMLDLLNTLSAKEDLLAALQMMRQVPPCHYTDQAWQRVLAILQVLRGLLAYFQMTIQQKKQIDFTEIALRAALVLGHEEMPSELALALDYRLKHILVDEFQDTSLLQFRLLERLTQSWQSGDEHSLFLVGDPLQSIYRFRQAEVGLFLRVWQQGFTHLPLQSIQLKQNFRAQENLVTFYNARLAMVLPKTSLMYEGAVAYHTVQAAKPALSIEPINYIACTQPHHYLQAFIQHIQTVQTSNPDWTIGILVRARSHLTEIILALRAAQIDFQARELSSLNDQPVVMDLLTWLKALLNLDDRLSWLAMLHAPYLDLSLEMIQQLFVQDQGIVWQRLLDWQAEQIAIDSAQIHALQTVIHAWQQARNQLQRLPLDQILWQLWQSLKAAAYWSDSIAVQSTEQFFAHLRSFQSAVDLLDIPAFEWHLSQCRFSTPSRPVNVELMTIHKAKGLEFDVIFLPELHCGGRHEEMPLLLFDEVMLPTGAKFLLAPLYEKTRQDDPIFNFLWSIQKKKAQHERLRLLYVACTRARQALYLYAVLGEAVEEHPIKPKSGTFLADLWPIWEQFGGAPP